jgi:hypothetical protein
MDMWILLNKSINIPIIGILDVLHLALMLKMSEATTNEASLLSSFTQKDQLELLCPLKDIKLTNFCGISSAVIV